MTAADPASRGWTRLPEDEGFIGLVGPFWRRAGDAGTRYGFLAEPRHANLIGAV